jgi:hypothetical protein
VNPPSIGRGYLGGCQALNDLEEVVELVHRLSVGCGDHEIVIIDIIFGGLFVGHKRVHVHCGVNQRPTDADSRTQLAVTVFFPLGRKRC